MNFEKLHSMLNEQVQWPEYYTFKFVVKTEQKSQVMDLLVDHEISLRPSKNGNYTSITSRKYFQTSDEVIEVYQSMKEVKGLISL